MIAKLGDRSYSHTQNVATLVGSNNIFTSY